MDLAKLFDSFYNRFILRDVFGKIVPGFILIVGISPILGSASQLRSEIQNYLNLNSNLLWLLLLFFLALGIGWLVGFAVERLGEITGVLIDPRNGTEEQEWLDLMIRFGRNTQARERERNLLERLVVIKEACGNSSVALGIVSLGLLMSKMNWTSFEKTLSAMFMLLSPYMLLFPLTVLVVSLALISHLLSARVQTVLERLIRRTVAEWVRPHPSQEPLERWTGRATVLAVVVLLFVVSDPSTRLYLVTSGAAILLWLMHLKIARRQLIYMQRVLELPPW